MNSSKWLQSKKSYRDIIHKRCESLCFYLTVKKLGDPQSSWWYWRRGTAFCLAGDPNRGISSWCCSMVLKLASAGLGSHWLAWCLPGSDWTSKTRWWLLHSLPVLLSSFQATLRYFLGKTSLLWEQKLHRHFPRPWGRQKQGSWQHFERKHLLFLISMSNLIAVLYLINFGS